jgi:hypothetical protein
MVRIPSRAPSHDCRMMCVFGLWRRTRLPPPPRDSSVGNRCARVILVWVSIGSTMTAQQSKGVARALKS